MSLAAARKADARGNQVVAKALQRGTLSVGDRARRRYHGHELFSVGQKDSFVATAERRLDNLGYQVGTVDGVFDRKTARAIEEFKHDQRNLGQVGVLGSNTREALKREAMRFSHAPTRGRTTEGLRTHRRLDALTEKAAARTRAEGPGVGIGDRGRAVKNIQAHLGAAGYHPKHRNGIFDERTQGALEAFQRHSGLTVSGRVDAPTWARLKKALILAQGRASPPQALGERSGAVRRSEVMLRELGYRVKVDGLFDRRTERAVEHFKRKHDLGGNPDAVGTATLRALRRASAPDAQRQRILRIAESQIGVRGENGGGGVKYSRYFGRGAEAYCSDFVSWVYTRAGRKLNEPYVPTLINKLKASHDWKGRHNPKPGDLVIFDWEKDGEADHVGIVKRVNRDGSIQTIEGNTPNPRTGVYGVWEKNRPMSDIVGFGKP